MQNNLFKKFLSFSYGDWAGLLVGLFTTPLITRLLSPAEFGKASMFILAVNILMIFIVFGTDQTFVRFFYEEKEENRGGLLYNCLKIPSYILLVTVFMAGIFYVPISNILFDEINFKMVLLLILGVIFQYINRFSILVIRMKQNGHLYSLLKFLNKAIYLIILICLYALFGSTYEIIVYATVLAIAIVTIVSLYFEKKFWNFKNLNLKNLIHSKKEIMTYAYPLVITTMITWLFQSFDRLAIKEWASFEELGIYAAAFSIITLLNIIQTTFSTFWAPVSIEHFEKNPADTLFYKNFFETVSFGMLLAAVLCIMGKDVIVLLLGEQFRSASNVMPFLVFMPLMYTLSEVTVIGISFYKKPRWNIIIATCACMVNIIGNWFLVPKYGATGAAISTAVSYIVFFIMRTQISLRYYSINYGLTKLYCILSLILGYAFLTNVVHNIFLNSIVGVLIISIIIAGYKKEVNVLRGLVK